MKVTICTLKIVEYYGSYIPYCNHRTTKDKDSSTCSKNIGKCPYLRSFNVEEPKDITTLPENQKELKLNNVVSMETL
ncbi:hypothetical protein LDC_0868 [sediment metagenome]|uniref:Uncharacterized protein n=1 Tax=sediment metagenome TaxID=749907 RepID=D9PH68_9ZZZZ